MKDDANIKPSSFKSWYQRIFIVDLSTLMNSIGTGWIFVLLILINIDIVGRTIFNSPLRGVTEIVSMTIVACVFLQLPHTIKVGRLTRSDIILGRLEKINPIFKKLLEFFYNIVGMVILLLLFFNSIPIFVEAWNIGEYEGAQGDFMINIWPVKLIIVVGSLVAALQCLVNSYKCFKAMLPRKFSVGR